MLHYLSLRCMHHHALLLSASARFSMPLDGKALGPFKLKTFRNFSNSLHPDVSLHSAII